MGSTRLAQQRLADFLSALGDDGPAPGAGAAAAVALALAAACARKAVRITEYPASVRSPDTELSGIIDSALESATADIELFPAFLERRDAASAALLLEADDRAAALRESLARLLPPLRNQVDPSVVTDVEAAAALVDAIETIQIRLRADNQRAITNRQLLV